MAELLRGQADPWPSYIDAEPNMKIKCNMNLKGGDVLADLLWSFSCNGRTDYVVGCLGK